MVGIQKSSLTPCAHFFALLAKNRLHFPREISRSDGFNRLVNMQKTKKSIAKRFKITGSGKLMRRKPGHRHLLRNKSHKQLKSMTKDQSVSEGFTKMYKKAILD